MADPNLFILISASIVLVALFLGAYEDIKTRRAPKWIWLVCAPFAAVSTLIWYINAFLNGAIPWILSVIITTTILSILCVFMGYRRGNGGDWRALFYISLLTPWLAPITFIASGLIGFIQVILDVARFRRIDYKSPWMVSITTAFVISIAAYFFI